MEKTSLRRHSSTSRRLSFLRPPPRSPRASLARLAAAAFAALLLAACSGLPSESTESPKRPSTGDARATTGPLSAESLAKTSADSTPTPVDETADPDSADADRTDADAADEDAPAALPAVRLTSRLMYRLLVADMAAQRGDRIDAAATFLELAEQTRDPRLARRATELYLASRSVEPALRAARLWIELAPGASTAQRTLEALLLATGHLDEAAPLLRERLAQARAAGAPSATWDQIGRMLMRSPDKAAAFALLQRLVTDDGNGGSGADRAAAHLALAELAHANGDDERAAGEAETALQQDPESEQAAILVASHLAATGSASQRAVELLSDFLARLPDSIDVRFALARLLAANGEAAAAREQFETLLRQAPDNPAILLSLAQLSWQAKQPDLAETYLRRYLDLPDSVARDNAAAWLFMGQLAEDSGRTEEALQWYARIERGEELVPALTRRALLLTRNGRLDEARALLRSAPAADARTRARLSAAEALILREAGRPDEALEVLTRAVQRMPEDIELLYDHAMAAERAGHLDAMETSLRKIISLRPDFAHAYNALGYTLANRGLRLPEAQELIEKALALRPGDAQIIDSLGWVLFRRGRIDAAISQLEKAWALQPEAEIGAHLGEALWHAGRRDEARRIWQQAAIGDPQNRILNETRARLDSGR